MTNITKCIEHNLVFVVVHLTWADRLGENGYNLLTGQAAVMSWTTGKVLHYTKVKTENLP